MSDAPPPAEGPRGGTGASTGKLVGFANFVRHNPKSDRFKVLDFDHLDVYCADATSTSRRFAAAFGLQLVATSDINNGNHKYTSVVMRSNDVRFVFTAPYFTAAPPPTLAHTETFPGYDRDAAFDFIKKHCLGVRAVALQVADAADAFAQCVANGGVGVQAPVTITDANGTIVYSEVQYYADVVLRFVQGRAAYAGQFMPGYADKTPSGATFGLRRLDHVVSNTPVLTELTERLQQVLGFHEFCEFIAEDVSTVDSGLNSMVMANNEQTVLLPVNEPTFGTRRKSQIQSFIEHHQGAGIQHIAISTPDILATIKQMVAQSEFGGVELMPSPGPKYYAEHVPQKMGTMVDAALIAECEKYGILIDRDEEGGLLQVFTKPVLDRPTLFIEIIQRLGCIQDNGVQKPACGGFGKGNFGALFKSIEDFEKQREGE